MNNKSRTLINVIGLPLIVSTILIGDFLFVLFISLIILLGTKEYVDLLKKHSIDLSSILLYIFQVFLILISMFYIVFSIETSNATFVELEKNLGLLKIGIVVLTFILPVFLVFILMMIEIFKKSSTPLLNVACAVLIISANSTT